MKENLSIIQGKRVQFTEFLLSCVAGELHLTCKVSIEESEFTIQFYGVSHITMDDLSFPMGIDGLEIRSNQGRGWEQERAYTVHDYEEERLRFFCKDFEILESDAAW